MDLLAPQVVGCSWDDLVLFRCLLLDVMKSLSDRDVQHELLERFSFLSFAGLIARNRVPDQKTTRTYRDMLEKADRSDRLCDLFLNP